MSDAPPVDSADRYELGAELGRGGNGIVVEAVDLRLGREVAIKLLHAGFDADTLRRFDRESRIAAGFRHPNAVEIFDAGFIGGQPFIAMERMRGPQLGDALESSPPVALHIIVEIAAALAAVLGAAHATGLVHRDLKPGNIFIDGTLLAPGRVRLVDFGLAFLAAPQAGELGRLTEEGVVVGTPAYMPPEQARGEPIGPPADIYALGCLLYELATGRPPFVGAIGFVMSAHVYLPPLPFAELELTRDFAPAYEELVFAMLAKDPAARPTAPEVARRLATLDEGPQRNSMRAALRRDRSGPAIEPPAELRATAPAAVPESELLVRLALLGEDPLLAAQLHAAGHVLVARADAEVLLVRLDDAGAPTSARAAEDKRPIIGLHAAPVPKMIGRAIRDGLASVVRWPSASGDLAARVRTALSASRRLPRA